MIAVALSSMLVAMAVALTPAVLVFSVETLLGVAALLRSGGRQHGPAEASTAPGDLSKSPPRVVILIPAHNEADGLAAVLTQIQNSVGRGAEILLVADNCSDATADVARDHGVTVIERQNKALRGKGYALSAGRDALADRGQSHHPDCVVILDADCTPDADAVAALARCAMTMDRPVQGRYLMRARDTMVSEPPSAAVSFSNFAFWLKNDVRQRGAAALGASAILTGSGMAIPWRLMEGAQLASGNIVEDLALGIAFVEQGAVPIYLPTATIWSEPASVEATRDQRLRWERGFLATARDEGAPLIRSGLRRRSFAPLWLGLHLMTPPTVLLTAATLLAMSLAWFMFFVFRAHWTVSASLAMAWLSLLPVIMLISIGAAWMAGGRRWLPCDHILALPSYLLLKILVYGGLLRGRGKEWTRTGRNKNSAGTRHD